MIFFLQLLNATLFTNFHHCELSWIFWEPKVWIFAQKSTFEIDNFKDFKWDIFKDFSPLWYKLHDHHKWSVLTMFENDSKCRIWTLEFLAFTKRPNKNGENSNFDCVTGSKFKIFPFLSGQNSKFPSFCRDKIRNSPLFIGSKFAIYPFLLGQNSKFTPFYWVNIL